MVGASEGSMQSGSGFSLCDTATAAIQFLEKVKYAHFSTQHFLVGQKSWQKL